MIQAMTPEMAVVGTDHSTKDTHTIPRNTAEERRDAADGPDLGAELGSLALRDLSDLLSIARGKVPLRLRLRLARRSA